MDTLCFNTFISFLLISAHCSVMNSKTTDNFLENPFTSKDVVQVQNVFAANCSKIKEDLSSVKNSLAVQNKQMQCMKSSFEDIFEIANETNGNVKKQQTSTQNLVGRVASLNSMLIAQEDESKTIVTILEAQGEKLQALTAQIKELVADKTETSNQTVASCPKDFREFQGKCYSYNENRMTWSDALDHCKRIGSSLAEPRSKLENDFFKDFINSYQRAGVWVGGTDQIREGEWRWESNNDIISGFTNWYDGPNDYLRDQDSHDCLYFGPDGVWTATPCEYEALPFVCQTSKDPTPNQTTKAWQRFYR